MEVRSLLHRMHPVTVSFIQIHQIHLNTPSVKSSFEYTYDLPLAPCHVWICSPPNVSCSCFPGSNQEFSYKKSWFWLFLWSCSPKWRLAHWSIECTRFLYVILQSIKLSNLSKKASTRLSDFPLATCIADNRSPSQGSYLHRLHTVLVFLISNPGTTYAPKKWYMSYLYTAVSHLPIIGVCFMGVPEKKSWSVIATKWKKNKFPA